MVKKITGGKNIVRVRTANATLPGDRVRVKAKRRGGTGAVIAAGLFLVVARGHAVGGAE